jgi:hypothetical protein
MLGRSKVQQSFINNEPIVANAPTMKIIKAE